MAPRGLLHSLSLSTRESGITLLSLHYGASLRYRLSHASACMHDE